MFLYIRRLDLSICGSKVSISILRFVFRKKKNIFGGYEGPREIGLAFWGSCFCNLRSFLKVSYIIGMVFGLINIQKFLWGMAIIPDVVNCRCWVKAFIPHLPT